VNFPDLARKVGMLQTFAVEGVIRIFPTFPSKNAFPILFEFPFSHLKNLFSLFSSHPLPSLSSKFIEKVGKVGKSRR